MRSEKKISRVNGFLLHTRKIFDSMTDSSAVSELWTRYAAALREHIQPRYLSYLSGLTCIKITDKTWELGLPEKSSLSFVESSLSAKMSDILRDLLRCEGYDDEVGLVFSLIAPQPEAKASAGLLPFPENPVHVEDLSTVDDRQAAFRVNQTAGIGAGIAPSAISRYIDDSCESEPFVVSQKVRRQSRLNPRYTFEGFVVGSSNEMALCAAKAVAGKPAKIYNPLFIYGGAGLGKTHLAQAIGNEMLDMTMLRVQYLTSEDFVNECIEYMTTGKMAEFRAKVRDNIDVLLIDDIQFISGKDRVQQEFFHTFNYLIENEKQIVLTSDRHPNEIKDIDERMRSRFCCDGWFDIQLPDFETRLAILRTKCRSEGIFLPDEVAQYVASKVATNVRELEGCVKRIKGAADAQKTRISLALAQKLIEPFYQKPQKLLNVDLIIHCVSSYFGISRDDLMGRCRKKEISGPRKVAMYLARNHTSLSLPAIGLAFDRDHTTIMSAVQSITNDLKTDRELELNVRMIEQKLFDNR